MTKVLCIFGTRPEAIKCAPIIKALEADPEFTPIICNTGQHQDLIQDVLTLFEITPDITLDIMHKNKSLNTLTASLIEALEPIFNSHQPDLTLVQGDTTTTFCGALASYYAKVPVIHLEAGLRSDNKYAPYPEEINRTLISHIADIHLCPTAQAAKNLKNEGIPNTHIIGNTVVDALQIGLKNATQPTFNFEIQDTLILTTIHRRENMGAPISNICKALIKIRDENPNTSIIFPAHPSPAVQKIVNKTLHNQPNIHIIPPLDYGSFIWLMKNAEVILTDSGGIQEEAPSLGTPVLVLRETTERPELIETGLGKLVGFNPSEIIKQTQNILKNQTPTSSSNPFGDGTATEKCLNLLKQIGKTT